MFSNYYNNKKVLVTGHTGFKGSWLTSWLIKLNAKVVGYSKDVPTNPSMFNDLELKEHIKHYIADIRDLKFLKEVINKEKPDIIFHLAAQAIVSKSYIDPVETNSTNIIGTMNVLESVKEIDFQCSLIMITSDKCYKNVEWIWGYKETDHLGGKDVYSGSKAAAEIVIHSYFHSFFKNHQYVKIGVGRAGNVIGGGDWAEDRIVVDCMKSWKNNGKVEIRSPKATRPWQHVLEPLSGYLSLGSKLSSKINGEAFNFGPKFSKNHTVIDLLNDLAKDFGISDVKNAYKITENIPFNEAGLLKLNCDKALFKLNWEANLDYHQTVKIIANWYKEYYKNNSNLFDYTLNQISEYEKIAITQSLDWTK
jgi:CDP-glucose 4,6-dehydratase